MVTQVELLTTGSKYTFTKQEDGIVTFTRQKVTETPDRVKEAIGEVAERQVIAVTKVVYEDAICLYTNLAGGEWVLSSALQDPENDIPALEEVLGAELPEKRIVRGTVNG